MQQTRSFMIARGGLALGAVAVGLVLFGCTQKVTLEFMRPAEITVVGVDRIGVEHFEEAGDDRGAGAASRLKVLVTDGLKQAGRYELVDLGSGSRRGQVDAVIVGRAWWSQGRGQGEVPVLRTRVVMGRKNNIPVPVEYIDYADRIPYTEGWGTLRVQLDLIRLGQEREELVTSLTHSGGFGERGFGPEGGQRIPHPDQVLERLLQEAAQAWVKRISPHKVSFSVPVMGAHPEAASLIGRGEYERAAQILRDHIESRADAQNNANFHYDLGLCYEAQGMLLDAISAYTKALDLGGGGVYAEALGRAERLKAEFLKLEQQQGRR